MKNLIIKGQISQQAVKLTLCMLFLSLSSFNSFSQYVDIEDFKEVGAGNFFVHLENEAATKKAIMQVMKLNKFPKEELVFRKGGNLFFASYYVNPADEKSTYLMYAERAREGYDLYLLYIDNNYHYLFDYHEGVEKYKLIYDPEKHKNKSITSLLAEKNEEWLWAFSTRGIESLRS